MTRKTIFGVIAIGALAAFLYAQESPYKDQGEFDISNTAVKETDPQKKIDALKAWEAKYPESKLKSTRDVMMAQSYLAIATGAFGKTDGPALDAGGKAAQTIVENLDAWFAPAAKPAQATDDQWKQAKTQFDEQSHSVLGWVAMQKKDNKAAEAEFKKVLAIDPGAAQISYYLGNVIIRQSNIDKYSEALYSLARAVGVTGAGALQPAAKGPAQTYLKKAYEGYHGDDSGLADLMKLAAGGKPVADADFHIRSIKEISGEAAQNEEKFKAEHPDLFFWRNVIKKALVDQGDAYFGTLKDVSLPPDGQAFKMFKAKVVSQTSPKELLVSIDELVGDATIKFDEPLKGEIAGGTELQFKGIVESWTKEPFNLAFTIDDVKADITGLPATAFGAAVKKPAAPGAKKGGPPAAPKKK
jgi:tetratricopeptide (TPR) repeat protein